MIAVRPVAAEAALSVIGRASPLAKLAVALVWLVGLALTTDLRPPTAIAFIAIAGGWGLGRIPPRSLALALLPLWVAALGITCFNAAFSPLNGDIHLAVAAQVGPLRVVQPAVVTGVGLGLRVIAIAAVGAVFGLTTDATRMVDALVQQARVPDRFAYGALAAFQGIPRLAGDLTALREARRIRGLRASWHPRLLVGLLVLAIRHGDRLAVAMDARGFASGIATRYRNERWRSSDSALLVVSTVLIVAILAAAR